MGAITRAFSKPICLSVKLFSQNRSRCIRSGMKSPGPFCGPSCLYSNRLQSVILKVQEFLPEKGMEKTGMLSTISTLDHVFTKQAASLCILILIMYSQLVFS